MAIYGHKSDGTPLKSQRETILYYLQSNPGTAITSWWAIKEFNFTRLAAIVKEIEKKDGIRLARRDVPYTTRYGGHTNYTEYWYEQPDELEPKLF